MGLVNYADITKAQKALEAISGHDGPVRTPLLPVPDPDLRSPLLIKPENLQPTGAFKIRGASHAVASLPEDVRRRGVVTYSSGNHARALAYAAKTFGVPVTVVVPHTAPAPKVAAAGALGAQIVPVDVAEREERAHAIADERGAPLIPPFDDPAVIAGQGTVGAEIAHDLAAMTSEPDPLVLVPVSGGGLISGVGVAVRSLLPQATVIGVEPELASDARESFQAGQRRSWSTTARTRTIADGLTAEPSELTFAHMRAVVDDVVTVTEDAIADTVGYLATTCRLVAEPSGAVAVATYRQHPDMSRTRTVVAIVSGGNIAPEDLVTYLRR